MFSILVIFKMDIILGLSLIDSIYPRDASSKILKIWLVNFKISRIFETYFSRILEFNFQFKTFSSIRKNYCLPSRNVFSNIIDKRNKQLSKGYPTSQNPKFSLNKRKISIIGIAKLCHHLN